MVHKNLLVLLKTHTKTETDMQLKQKFTMFLHMSHSAIHKAAIWPATVQNDLRRLFLPEAPIDSQ